jgi:hypothetical protein
MVVPKVVQQFSLLFWAFFVELVIQVLLEFSDLSVKSISGAKQQSAPIAGEVSLVAQLHIEHVTVRLK